MHYRVTDNCRIITGWDKIIISIIYYVDDPQFFKSHCIYNIQVMSQISHSCPLCEKYIRNDHNGAIGNFKSHLIRKIADKTKAPHSTQEKVKEVLAAIEDSKRRANKI